MRGGAEFPHMVKEWGNRLRGKRPVAGIIAVGGDVPPVLDGVLGTLLGVEPIEVSGAMLPDGTLELNTDGLLNECPTNDCERLVLLGSTLDTDKDGKMDTYTGTIGGLVQVSGSLVPLIGNFTTAVATAS